jgi:hypothetical protein
MLDLNFLLVYEKIITSTKLQYTQRQKFCCTGHVLKASLGNGRRSAKYMRQEMIR